MKIRHELKPYGLNENEWRCFLIHHKNANSKDVTLAQVARRLVMELEQKITEVELIQDREKNPLEPKASKALKLYLQQIKQDRYKIKYLVDCSPATTAKRLREKSGSSDSETDPKLNRRASRTTSRGTVAKTDGERSTSRQRE